MKLEETYLDAFNDLKASLEIASLNPQDAISLIDLTLLNEFASDEELIMLGKKANLHQVAAICVMPEQLKKIALSSTIKRATVVNFPKGFLSDKELLADLDTILTNYQPDEIDYVFPYQTYLEGEEKVALSQCKQAYKLCQQKGATFKVILETGALPSLEIIYKISTEVINSGCDFLKTSTGKIAEGATLASAFTILKAIKDSKIPCGLKVSGGLKTAEQAFSYMILAKQTLGFNLEKSWFRIGASSLLNELINH
ncbi:MAG: deoxyribose-phosphate aldolase [Tatlockia sp.]|nr:deoxyribose-phosphate aldolase [Tatlockia sp.]